MQAGKQEWVWVLALGGALAFRSCAWAPPAGMDRAAYVELLAAAEAAGRSPRDEALRRGLTDEQLGRAAYAWGDLTSETALAARLQTIPPKPAPPPTHGPVLPERP